MSRILDIYLKNNFKPQLKKGFKLDKKYSFNVELFEEFYQKHLKYYFSREFEFQKICEITPNQFKNMRNGNIDGIELRSFEIMANIMAVDFFDLIIIDND